MQYTVQYTIYTKGHARESCPAVPRCGLKSIDPTQVQPGLTNPAIGAIMISPVPDESPRLKRWIDSIIGHFTHSETNHNKHGVLILHSNQILASSLTPWHSTQPTANTSIYTKRPMCPFIVSYVIYFFFQLIPKCFCTQFIGHARRWRQCNEFNFVSAYGQWHGNEFNM